jgi:hypothetical protein
MTIYLQPEVKSGLGEDTFWCFAEREFPGTCDPIPAGFLSQRDQLLQYSTVGPPKLDPASQGLSVALLWELFPEMRLQLGSREWDDIIARTEKCAFACDRRVVSTKFAVDFYKHCGHVDVLPIGVDCELFRPLRHPEDLRRRHGIPIGKRVGFWCGTKHSMKGFDRLVKYAGENPDIHWLIVWKSKRERGHLPGATEFVHVPQATINELMNCADFFLSPGRLRPFFMVEWEAMAAGLPMVNISGLEKDFELAEGESPRERVFAEGWDRHSAKARWLRYLGLR